jgi:hypothetical protein
MRSVHSPLCGDVAWNHLERLVASNINQEVEKKMWKQTASVGLLILSLIQLGGCSDVEETSSQAAATATKTAERFLRELEVDFNVLSCRKSTVGRRYHDTSAECYYSDKAAPAKGLQRLECDPNDCSIPVCVNSGL